MLELIVVISMIAALAAVSMGRTSHLLAGWRTTRAAQALSEELQTGFAMVGRNRKPLIITLDTVKMELRMMDRAGIIYRRRNFGSSSEYKLNSKYVAPSRLTVEVYPPGLAADSLSIGITSIGNSRRVRMLRGGMVQICASAVTTRCD